MKLELKHLAPYLPCCLETQWELLEDQEITMDTQNIDYIIKNQYKPILRPLSDLTKDDKGSTIIQTISAQCPSSCNPYEEWVESYIDDPKSYRIPQAPYEIVEELLRQHFDVFGLIEQGLAIDLNTIKL